MGAAFSLATPTGFPTATSTLCVLPLRTNGQARFSVAPGPMPAPLTTRLGDMEWQTLVESINAELLPLSHFGFMSLLLPFLLVDLLTMVLLCAIDPWLLISPWDYGFSELLLPISLELALVFCGFPLMVHVVNRRMATVQTRVRSLLDTASRQLGSRGVNFQLKQAPHSPSPRRILTSSHPRPPRPCASLPALRSAPPPPLFGRRPSWATVRAPTFGWRCR